MGGQESNASHPQRAEPTDTVHWVALAMEGSSTARLGVALLWAECAARGSGRGHSVGRRDGARLPLLVRRVALCNV